MTEAVIEIHVELPLATVTQLAQHPLTIFLVNETIGENAQDLMGPQTNVLLSVITFFSLHHQDTNDDLAEIAQIESIMNLRRRWKKSGRNAFVYVQSSENNFLRQTEHFRWVTVCLHLEIKNGLENHTRSDEGASATWRTHRCNRQNVFELLESDLLQIVPTTTRCKRTVVDKHTQDLNWRLRSINFFCWHIQIVNHDNELLADGRSIYTLPSLVNLGVNQTLSLITFGLSREAKSERIEFVFVHAKKNILHVGGLTGTGWAAEQQRPHVVDGETNHPGITNRIQGLDE
eukprot:gene212-gene182